MPRLVSEDLHTVAVVAAAGVVEVAAVVETAVAVADAEGRQPLLQSVVVAVDNIAAAAVAVVVVVAVAAVGTADLDASFEVGAAVAAARNGETVDRSACRHHHRRRRPRLRHLRILHRRLPVRHSTAAAAAVAVAVVAVVVVVVGTAVNADLVQWEPKTVETYSVV